MLKNYTTYLIALTLLSILHGVARAGEPPAQALSNVANGQAASQAGSPAAVIEQTVQQVLGRLNADDVRKAKELGLNPRKLVKNIPSPSEPWKSPVNVWIRELYEEKQAKAR